VRDAYALTDGPKSKDRGMSVFDVRATGEIGVGRIDCSVCTDGNLLDSGSITIVCLLVCRLREILICIV
jgi:hypothetical protein